MRLLVEVPAFRRLWLARLVSGFGDGITLTALVLLFAPRGASSVSLLLLAGVGPRLLGPVAGAVADRVDARAMLVAAPLVEGACMVGVATLSLPTPGVLALVALAAGAATCFAPAFRRGLPDLVPADQLDRANALLGAAMQLSMLTGSAMGGVLVAAFEVPTALLVDAATFAVAAGLLSRLPGLPAVAVPRGSVLAETRAGLAYSRSDPVVRSLLLGMLALVAFLGVDNVAYVFLVTEEIGAGEVAFGVVNGTFSGAMLMASLVLVRTGVAAPVKVMIAGCLLSTVSAFATGLAPSLLVVLLASVAGGAGNAMEVIAADTLMQRVVPRHLLGRVGGAYGTAVQLAFVVSYGVGGPLTAAIGPRGVFLVAAAGSLLAPLLLLPALRAERRGRGS